MDTCKNRSISMRPVKSGMKWGLTQMGINRGGYRQNINAGTYRNKHGATMTLVPMLPSKNPDVDLDKDEIYRGPLEINENEIYAPEEAAKRLKLKTDEVIWLIESGLLPATKMIDSYRILGRNILELFF